MSYPGNPQQARLLLRNWPVYDVGCSATSSGRPATTTCPPSSPPSGPRSMIQSAVLMTSRLCSNLVLIAIGSQDVDLAHVFSKNTPNGQLLKESWSTNLIRWVYSHRRKAVQLPNIPYGWASDLSGMLKLRITPCQRKSAG